MNIGDKIKECRLKKNWTQEQLAKLLNVSRSAVSGWEVGRNYPDLDTIVSISDLFDISLDKLLREDKQMTKEVSKKIRMNKYYKIIIGIIAVIFILYIGYNQKLRMDEGKYRENLAHFGWSLDADQNDGNGYKLTEGRTIYWTYILPTGSVGFPLEEQNVNIITRKESLVIDVHDRGNIELVISKSNDPTVLYSGKVEVNNEVEITQMDADWSTEKQAFMKGYIEQNKKEYQILIDKTIEKIKEIVTKR
ncbi:helix-turn-helix domain-containing protein [Enterococcus sp. LJL99]